MLVLGAGHRLVMQVLTIIVQNTADYRDLGVATSGVTFFRTLGSSFGAASFGTSTRTCSSGRLPAAYARSPGWTRPRSNDARGAAPATRRSRSRRSSTLTPTPCTSSSCRQSRWHSPRSCSPGSSRRCRCVTAAAPGVTDVGDAFGMPENSDRAPAPGDRHRPSDALGHPHRRGQPLAGGRHHLGPGRRLVPGAGPRPVPRGGSDHPRRQSTLRTRVPAEVLAPAFAAALHRGYLVDQRNELELTERGRAADRAAREGSPRLARPRAQRLGRRRRRAAQRGAGQPGPPPRRRGH